MPYWKGSKWAAKRGAKEEARREPITRRRAVPIPMCRSLSKLSGSLCSARKNWELKIEAEEGVRWPFAIKVKARNPVVNLA